MEHMLADEVTRAARYGRTLSLAMVDTYSAEQIIVAADRALYAANAAGRNCVIRASEIPATAAATFTTPRS